MIEVVPGKFDLCPECEWPLYYEKRNLMMVSSSFRYEMYANFVKTLFGEDSKIPDVFSDDPLSPDDVMLCIGDCKTMDSIYTFPESPILAGHLLDRLSNIAAYFDRCSREGMERCLITMQPEMMLCCNLSELYRVTCECYRDGIVD